MLPRIIFFKAKDIGEALYIDGNLVMIGNSIYPTDAVGTNGMLYERRKLVNKVDKWPDNIVELPLEALESCVA